MKPQKLTLHAQYLPSQSQGIVDNVAFARDQAQKQKGLNSSLLHLLLEFQFHAFRHS